MQRMRILTPPSLRMLWDDDTYRSFLERKPRLPTNLQHGQPWMVAARWTDDYIYEMNKSRAWAHRNYCDYFQALDFALELLDRRAIADVAVISRRKLYQPFVNFTWEPRFSWCGRCRRPTLFRKTSAAHHALRNAPAITLEDPYRCYYCGMRRVAQPNYKERFAA